MRRSTRAPLHLHSAHPVCAGPPPETLIAQYVTPNDFHYVRNHAPVPEADPATYRLDVGGLVDRPLEVSLRDIVNGFARHQVLATLQCAGNRRAELSRVKPFENEVMWGGDAIGTAEWTGARLADVLRTAGVASTASHVWFDGLDRVAVDGTPTSFGASIELERAVEDDVVLAYEMNGAPLPPEHGAPVRVVIPGAIGARSVKWLGRITAGDRPSDNHFQRVSYRVPVSGDGAPWQPIERSHLNSFIAMPADGARTAAGNVQIAGYAVPTGTSSIVHVDLAIDSGEWLPATLNDTPRPATWVRWQFGAVLAPGEHTVRVRARDSSGAQQTADLHEAWNPKGYVNGAIHAITVYAYAR